MLAPAGCLHLSFRIFANDDLETLVRFGFTEPYFDEVYQFEETWQDVCTYYEIPYGSIVPRIQNVPADTQPPKKMKTNVR